MRRGNAGRPAEDHDRSSPESIRQDLEKTRSLLQKYRAAQEKAYENANEQLATTCARKITQLHGKVRALEKQFEQSEKEDSYRRQTAGIVKRVDDMVKVYYSVKSEAEHLWEKEVLLALKGLHVALFQGTTDTKGSSSSFTRFISNLAGTSQNRTPTAVECINQIVKNQLAWIDEFERLIIRLDGIVTTDMGEVPGLISERLGKIKNARKQQIKRIQNYISLVEAAAKHVKMVEPLLVFLDSKFSSDPDTKNAGQHSLERRSDRAVTRPIPTTSSPSPENAQSSTIPGGIGTATTTTGTSSAVAANGKPGDSSRPVVPGSPMSCERPASAHSAINPANAGVRYSSTPATARRVSGSERRGGSFLGSRMYGATHSRGR
eukprot:CAMPEP_0184491116 /NCGR_PEP_ID=MMETSP0113_2-20130426/19639_1 /TAXON_ID=91329 /ORGANISM="Norrisiella sphaerica, Strain BC52" /LENGTH=376 /DNA_ID=CAMNT_0026875333 /DNA_START=84 /DNA_END=1214 /DNA_ORIENTATION=+